MFSDVLLTVDYDRTLTGPDSVVPERNWEAIRYFIENGGAFTINTGRSVSSFARHLGNAPVNAPILMYNGSARWEDGKLTKLILMPIELNFDKGRSMGGWPRPKYDQGILERLAEMSLPYGTKIEIENGYGVVKL